MNGQYHHIFRDPPGADTVVLLLHGILSAPQYFRFLLDDIPQQYAVSGILLDGHGAPAKAISGTNMQIWKAQVHGQFRRLSAQYRHIIVAAHSMGTLFALQLAAEHPKQIRAMLLLGVPLAVHLTPFGALCSAAVGSGYHPAPNRFPRAYAMQQACSILPDYRLWRYLPWIPRYLELFAEISRTKNILHRVAVPCAVFQSAHDELVSVRALPQLAAHPSFQLRVLRESSHFYYTTADEARIRGAWRKMLRCNQHLRGKTSGINEKGE